MKVIVLSGFLGSGKTSALLSLAAHLLPEGCGRGTRLVVIENEVGDVGIDDTMIAQAGFDVKTLLAGCICCTLATDLITTLNDVYARYRPDYVIFEPSGIAYPERIVKGVSNYASGIDWIRQITVIDARRWRRIHAAMPALAEGQIQGARLLLLNKCDMADEDEIAWAERDLHGIAPDLPIRRVCASHGVDGNIWREFLG